MILTNANNCRCASLLPCVLTKMQHKPQLDDPISSFNQSPRGSDAKQESVQTKKDNGRWKKRDTSFTQGPWVHLSPNMTSNNYPAGFYPDRKRVVDVYCLFPRFHSFLLWMSTMTLPFPHRHYHNHSPVRTQRTMNDAICDCVRVRLCFSVAIGFA